MAITLACASIGVIEAAPIVLTNPGFETDAAADGGGFNAAVTGWGPFGTGGSPATSFKGTFDPGAANGAIYTGENNYFLLQATPNGGVAFSGGGQNVSAPIQANMRYTLTVDVASYSAGFPFPSVAPFDDTYVGTGQLIFARLVNVTGGSIGFAQTAGVTLVSNDAAPIGTVSTMATWTRVYETGAAPADLGGTLAIQLFLQSDAAGGQRTALFDNVALDVSPIPEPSSFALMGVGCLVLAGWRRRYSQKTK
ncbi:MAG: PEP-CTERM sorting domain-containing protein [Verrucomicrobiota bacterium]